MDTFFAIVSFLLSSSHETFVEENRWFGGGAIVEPVIWQSFFFSKDASHDRGNNFRLKWFLNDRAPSPKIAGKIVHSVFRGPRRVLPRPWDLF